MIAAVSMPCIQRGSQAEPSRDDFPGNVIRIEDKCVLFSIVISCHNGSGSIGIIVVRTDVLSTVGCTIKRISMS